MRDEAARRDETGQGTLLGAGDPAPVAVCGRSGESPFLLVSDHGGRAVPARLGDLGVAAPDWDRHIAWDIGMAGLGRLLAERLDTILIEQAYSRLVIDCNRAPGHPTSIVGASDGVVVPANADLDAEAVAGRLSAIFHPYHDRIAGELAARRDRPTVVVALHSFTPEMGGVARPWHVGILHNHDPRFGLILKDLLDEEGDLVVGDNEPYALTDGSDYTIPVHAEARGLPHVELEIRQDLVADAEGQREWAGRLARLLPRAWARYSA
ncbi:N-formylglutamate amidohydrolase [Gluconacetobacter diazotrophicus]|uniref:Putative N-formylglutamate amidohydrolase n=1 Tax=Gluconacetobacter diazotrophicus (strain ATCC 49037 / DSM 5601 / CCUG 37298 / CIP 103539 / LMG 7603 / PAl5) TaxID=272568 RepID=A9HRH2_GLUDA|nr:N-formylglutamate amidohydrolase [Gluconacetobacter diazotrophicus]CAP56910.1 putative N-formylglutamate amidohydrolase [Gluconacetobacter diazotrophicus PA1 5]